MISINRYWIGSIILIFALSVFAENDPTMPPKWDPKAQTAIIPKGIVLTGIFTRNGQTTAIINEKSIGAGDFIDGYEVTKITDNLVYLKNNQGIFVVPLTPKVKTERTVTPDMEK